MSTEELLAKLGESWDVTLTGSPVTTWCLVITSHAAHWDETFSHTYCGSLKSVVARAYAGEPGDRR